MSVNITTGISVSIFFIFLYLHKQYDLWQKSWQYLFRFKSLIPSYAFTLLSTSEAWIDDSSYSIWVNISAEIFPGSVIIYIFNIIIRNLYLRDRAHLFMTW